MDQQLMCTKEGHEFNMIHGICMSKFCQADPRILCLTCLKTIHAQCKLDFLGKPEFIKQLQELKKKFQEESEPRIIAILRDLVYKSHHFLKLLDMLTNNIMQQYDKCNRIHRIDQIFMNQDLMSVNDWKEGYKLLTDEPITIPYSTDSLIEQLNNIKISIASLSYFQQKDQDDFTQRQLTEQSLMHQDLNMSITYKPLVISTSHQICTIAQSINRYFLASAGYNDFSIQIWDIQTGNQVGVNMEGHTDWIRSMCYSKCGKYLVSGSHDKTIIRWDVLTYKQIGERLIGHLDSVTGVSYSQDYIISCSKDKTIRFWEPTSGIEIANKRIRHINSIWCLCLSPTQNDLVFGDENGSIKIWDYLKHIQMQQSFIGHTKQVNSIQYSANGLFILSGSDDKTIRIWDTQTNKCVKLFIGHTNYVLSVGFSHDTIHVISGGWDKTVRLWNIAIGQQIGQSLTHHKDRVFSTQFSLDRDSIITGCWDNQIRIMRAPII